MIAQGQCGVTVLARAKPPDWAALRARAVAFASVSVTESLNWTDEDAARQLVAASRAGVHAGIRHFARPGAVADQVRHLVRTGMPLGAFAPGALAPTLDVRATGVDDRFVKSWIKAIRHATGIRRVLVAAPYEMWVHGLRPGKWADDDVVLWLARHNGIPGRPGWFHPRLGLHQHGEGDGIGAEALVYPFTLTDVLL